LLTGFRKPVPVRAFRLHPAAEADRVEDERYLVQRLRLGEGR